MFGRRNSPPPPVPVPLDDYTAMIRRMGRLEAQVETLDLQWIAYRDELKRLAARLERRDQRAQERETREAEGSNGGPPNLEAPDAISAHVLARRSHHELRRLQSEG